MILMALCIIDLIGANALLGPGGEGALDTPGPKWHSQVSRAPSPPLRL
jgi:hypothetical protein